MGAGRSFVLSAVLAALAAGSPAAVLGIEAPAASSALSQAQAVGPYAALSQGNGIELRDADNRPISRAALARELRAGAAAESEPVSSRAARLLAQFLDRLSAPVSGLRGGAHGVERHGALAAATPRPPKARFVRVVSPAPQQAAPAAPAAADAAPRTSLGRAFNLPLRI